MGKNKVDVDSDGSFVMELVCTVISDLFLHGSLAYRRYCILTLNSKENGKLTETVRKESSLDRLFLCP